jgi:hypothetical protein
MALNSCEVPVKSMFVVLLVGAAVSVATAIFPAEAVRACTPFAVLSTGVLLLAYWVIACDATPALHDSATHKRAA